MYRVDAGNGGSPFLGKVTVHARKADRPAAGTPTGVIRMRYGQEMMFGGGRAHRRRPGGGGQPPDGAPSCGGILRGDPRRGRQELRRSGRAVRRRGRSVAGNVPARARRRGHDRDAHPQAARRAARRLRLDGGWRKARWPDGLPARPKPRIFATEVPKPPALVAKPGAGESGSRRGADRRIARNGRRADFKLRRTKVRPTTAKEQPP